MKIKQLLLDECNKFVQKRITDYKNEITLIKESIESNDQQGDDEDDSGSGKLLNDLETNMVHLNDAHKSLGQLKLVNPKLQSTYAVLGSIVKTDSITFFIAISLGKIIVEDNEYYAISMASPIGQLLKQKIAGDHFEFNGKKYQILEVS